MNKQKGFSLVEIAIVLAIIGFITASAVTLTGGLRDTEKLKVTDKKLEMIDQALIQYVAINKHLPCPADGNFGVASTTPPNPSPNPKGISRETGAGSSCYNQNRGVVPWITLGLSSGDVLDGWGNFITYRVDPLLASPASGNVLDVSDCSLVGTRLVDDGNANGFSATAGVTPRPIGSCLEPGNYDPSTPEDEYTEFSQYFANKGLLILDAGGTTVGNPANNTGAAYILISHGKDRSGNAKARNGVTLSHIPRDSLDDNSNAGEGQNRNNATIRLAATPDNYVSDSINGYFDDITKYRSVISLVGAAGFKPLSN